MFFYFLQPPEFPSHYSSPLLCIHIVSSRYTVLKGQIKMRLHFSNVLHKGKKKLHKNDTVGEHNNKIASKNEIYSVSHYVT